MARKINNTITDALVLVGGGVVGAGLALLLTPQSGKRSRKDIVRYGKSMGKKSDKAIRSFSDNMSGFSEEIAEMAIGVLHRR